MNTRLRAHVEHKLAGEVTDAEGRPIAGPNVPLGGSPSRSPAGPTVSATPDRRRRLAITCFATNTTSWPIEDLEVRHRQRARAEDRIRNVKDTGLRNLPFHAFDQNRIWLQIVALASDLLAWTQTLAFNDNPARRWEPKRLRLRILAVAGRIICSGRRRRLRLPRGWPWADLINTGWTALQTT